MTNFILSENAKKSHYYNVYSSLKRNILRNDSVSKLVIGQNVSRSPSEHSRDGKLTMLSHFKQQLLLTV